MKYLLLLLALGLGSCGSTEKKEEPKGKMYLRIQVENSNGTVDDLRAITVDEQ